WDARMDERADEPHRGSVRRRERALDVVVAHAPRGEAELLSGLAEVRSPDEDLQELVPHVRSTGAARRAARNIAAIGRSTIAIARNGSAIDQRMKSRMPTAAATTFETMIG